MKPVPLPVLWSERREAKRARVKTGWTSIRVSRWTLEKLEQLRGCSTRTPAESIDELLYFDALDRLGE